MTNPNPPIDLSGAVDLSALKRQPAADAVYVCDVQDGCNLQVRGVKHETQADCLNTVIPYVYMFKDAEEGAQQLIAATRRMEQLYTDLVAQYRTVLAEKDRLAADLRALRKETGTAEVGVLEGAGDLAASMAANFGPKPKQTEVMRAPATVDAFKAEQYAAIRQNIKDMGCDPAVVDGVADENLGDLYERVVNGDI